MFSNKGLAGKYKDVQSFPPLDILKASTEDYERFASKLGMTVDEMLNEADFPKSKLAYKYAPGESLVRPEQVEHLPTQMRRLHDWYMKACVKGDIMLIMAVRDEHYFRGDDEIHIEFEELVQLFNQDAMDKYLISCYCL